MDEIKVVRVSDFAEIPGARNREDGDNSAQEFYEDCVKPVADEVFGAGSTTLVVDLDNTRGYPSSFISELAKLLSIDFKKVKKIRNRLVIKSDENPGLIDRFWDGFNKKYA